MPVITQIIAQADTGTGIDMLAGSELQTVNYWREIQSVGFVGSTNPGDVQFDLKSQGKAIGEGLSNTRGGANLIPNRDDAQFINQKVPPGVPLMALMRGASVANPVVLVVKFKNATFKRRRRTTYRRK